MSAIGLILILAVAVASAGYAFGTRHRPRYRTLAMTALPAVLTGMAAIALAIADGDGCYEACGSRLIGTLAGVLLVLGGVFFGAARIAAARK